MMYVNYARTCVCTYTSIARALHDGGCLAHSVHVIMYYVFGGGVGVGWGA